MGASVQVAFGEKGKMFELCVRGELCGNATLNASPTLNAVSFL